MITSGALGLSALDRFMFSSSFPPCTDYLSSGNLGLNFEIYLFVTPLKGICFVCHKQKKHSAGYFGY